MPSTLYGAAAEFLRERYKGELTEDENSVTVGTAVSTVIEGDADRLGLLILNLSVNEIYVSIDNSVSATNGIRLGANGGSIALNVTDDGMIQTRTWYGLSTGAGSACYVLELSRFIADRQIPLTGGIPV